MQRHLMKAEICWRTDSQLRYHSVFLMCLWNCEQFRSSQMAAAGFGKCLQVLNPPILIQFSFECQGSARQEDHMSMSARWEGLVNIMYLSLVRISSRGANCISHTILNCSYWNCVLQEPQAELFNLHNSVLQLDHRLLTLRARKLQQACEVQL